MTRPLVSVVVPTYNRAHLVGRAIDSALAQTYKPIEVVVVDDGSTDDTSRVLARYRHDSRVRVVSHVRNQGVAAAKNTGLDHVRGQFATILDSDDELFPHAVERLIGVFDQLGAEVGMVFANCVDPATGEWTGRGLPEPGFVSYVDAITARFHGEFWGIWRTEALGTRRFDTRFPGGEYLVWHDLYRETKVYYVHEALRKYHRGTPGSVSQVRFDREHLDRMASMYEAYLQRFGDDMLRFAPDAYAKHVQATALWHILAGRREAGWRLLLDSVKAAPTARSAMVAVALGVAPVPLLRYALRKRRQRQ